MNDGTYYEPELADPRVSYAVRFENDSHDSDRVAAVAERAVRAMRDGNRNMDGTARADHPRTGRKAPGGAPGSPALTDLTVAPGKSVSLLRASFRERARRAHLAGDAKAEPLWRAREHRVREIVQEASHAAGQRMRAGHGAGPGPTGRRVESWSLHNKPEAGT
jgi:hypothetical protein